jgi:hypothetical protein
MRYICLIVLTHSLRRKEVRMASKKGGGKGEVTSAKAASAAGKVLANPKSSAAAKIAAASALTQKPGKKK